MWLVCGFAWLCLPFLHSSFFLLPSPRSGFRVASLGSLEAGWIAPRHQRVPGSLPPHARTAVEGRAQEDLPTQGCVKLTGPRAVPARGPVAGAFRLKSGCLTWGAGNILPPFGGTEARIGKVHFTPNELGAVLNEESALPNYEVGVRQPGPCGFGQTL
jgi:hypothetical protein